MGTRAVTPGPIGEHVRHRVATFREARRLTLAQLSDRLGQLGRPILPTGISKIENGERRIDVDDLVALALALEVTPNALLIPAGSDTEARLTNAVAAPAAEAWQWASGGYPLRIPPAGAWTLPTVDPQGEAAKVDDESWEFIRQFRRENHPYRDDLAAESREMRTMLGEASEEIARLRTALKDRGTA